MRDLHPIQQTLWLTLFLNLAVAIGKIILGFVTGALAIRADGFHSLTDGAGNVAGLIGHRIAAQPADEEHPYGHRRFETLASLAIGVLLALTAWEVLQGAWGRFLNGAQPSLTLLAFGVLIITLLVNLFVSELEIRVGQHYQSEILLADARNTRADVFVTLSVLLSSVLVRLTGLAWIDTLAALIVVGLIGRAAWEILQETGRVLVDTAPYSPLQLRDVLTPLPQDAQLISVRSRGTRAAPFIDVDVALSPDTTIARSESIARSLRYRLCEALCVDAHVRVHAVATGNSTQHRRYA